MSIVAPRYIGMLERAKETALKQDLAVMREAISNFHHDLNQYPANLEELVQKKYLRTIPVDPITDRSDMWISVYSTDPSEQGLVDVASGAKGATNQRCGCGRQRRECGREQPVRFDQEIYFDHQHTHRTG